MAFALVMRKAVITVVTLGFFVLVYASLGHPISGLVVLTLLVRQHASSSTDVYVASLYARLTARQFARQSDEARSDYADVNTAVGYPEDLVTRDEIQFGKAKTLYDAGLDLGWPIVTILLMAHYVFVAFGI